MKRKSRGQTLVEFALVFPVIMAFLFGAIEMGFYIFTWSELQFGARVGAEQASLLPPREPQAATTYHSGGYASDPCLEEIQNKLRDDIITPILDTNIYISFHDSTTDTIERTTMASRAIGNIIQVRLNYKYQPLTPIGTFLTGANGLEFDSVSRRTIVSVQPGLVGADPRYVNCR